MNSKLLLVPLAIGLSSAIYAEQVSVDFDPVRTAINWMLAGNVHTIHGTFKLKQGHITFNSASGAISGEIVVDATSGESGSEVRDKRMHKDVLQSQRFPEIKFVPTRLAAPLPLKGTVAFRLTGLFTIHGAAHEVTVPLEATISGSEVTGEGKFVIPFVEWGMKDPSVFFFKVDKTVGVDVTAVGRVVNGP